MKYCFNYLYFYRKILEGIENIKTRQISIEGILSDYAQEIGLEIPAGIKCETKGVRVEIKVENIEETK